ncbi:MAG TPA: hypothetical protein V6D29_24075 [Leptolyngbyaceae cyanobacterium]
MKPTLPDWVKPGAIAVHGTTLFAIAKAQRSPYGEMVLADAPTGGTRYPLSACEQAKISDLKAAQVFIFEGMPITLLPTQDPNLFHLSNRQRNAYVRISTENLEFEQSVLSFANFFGGVIVPEEAYADAT